MTRQAIVAALAYAAFALGLAHAGTAPVADLTITNSDGEQNYTAGDPVVYTIVVGNNGPDAVTAAAVSDPATSLPQVLGASWTCVAAGGASCTAGPVTGSISTTVDLPVGGTATFTLLVVTSTAAIGDLVNTSTVTAPVGSSDPVPGNDSATDTNTAARILTVATATGIDSATCGLTSACKTIQQAIANTHPGDTIVVGAGTYNECVGPVNGAAAGRIRLESDEFRMASTNVATILDGVGVCDTASAIPGPVVTLYEGSMLRGFTITHGGNGGVTGSGRVKVTNNLITANAGGGGVRVAMAAGMTDPELKVVVKANTITSNTSTGPGAGVFVDARFPGLPMVVEIDTNTIKTNTAGDGTSGVPGSGIAVTIGTAAASDRASVAITTNTVDGNVAKNATGDTAFASGGGVYVATGAGGGFGTETVTIGGTGVANVVRNNVSEGFGGGLAITVQPSPGGTHTVTIDTNTISANTGKRGGGGMSLLLHALDLPAGPAPAAAIRVTRNTITGNHAQGALSDANAKGGGGIYAELLSQRTAAGAVLFEISGNSIQKNDATTHGGGASLRASADDDPVDDGATAAADATISFHNNLVAKNLARDASSNTPSGGAVHGAAVARGALAHAALTHDFLTVVENETEAGVGGFEWEEQRLPDTVGPGGTTSFVLTNSIVSDNQGSGIGGTVVPGPSATVAMTYNDVFGNFSGNYTGAITDPTGTNGNVSLDPLLDALFLPRLCGPVVDIGDPAISAAEEPLPNGGRVNLGHLGNTSSATRTFPDVNGDGTIDGLDILGIAASFSAVSPSPRYFTAADRDLNLRIDGDDLAFVSAFYAQTCP